MQTLQQKRSGRAARQAQETERQSLLAEYYDTLLQLRQVRAAFQQVTDPELISACVYEMNALQQRYAYLLQRMKREKVTCLQVLR